MAVGHSLGEYSALVATGYMSFADALKVVDVRGRGMQACAEERGGTMAAVIGLDTEVLEEICGSLEDVWLANYNSPGQLVMSGAVEVGAQGRGTRSGAGCKTSVAAPGIWGFPYALHGRRCRVVGRSAGKCAVHARACGASSRPPRVDTRDRMSLLRFWRGS